MNQLDKPNGPSPKVVGQSKRIAISSELYDALNNLERLVSAHCDLEGAAVRGAVQRIRDIRTKESQQ